MSYGSWRRALFRKPLIGTPNHECYIRIEHMYDGHEELAGRKLHLLWCPLQSVGRRSPSESTYPWANTADFVSSLGSGSGRSLTILSLSSCTNSTRWSPSPSGTIVQFTTSSVGPPAACSRRLWSGRAPKVRPELGQVLATRDIRRRTQRPRRT
jgi:hypothetical protein